MAGESRLTPATRDLCEQVRSALPDGPLAVALSGGADSAVLAWVAVAAGSRTRGITVDHGLPESGPLVEAAVRVAALLEIPHTVVLAHSTDTSEAALREARYEVVEAAADPDETLLTGHTSDDQAETVLGNFLRGAGTTGLAGIPSARGRWVRPMLGVSRDATRAAAADLGLPFADDPGNVDVSIRRSRLRVETIPHLEQFNPSLRDVLVRSARLFAADDDVLKRQAAAIPMSVGSGEVRIAAAAIRMAPVGVASRAVRRALRIMLHPYAGDAGDVDAVMALAAGEAVAASISGGLLAEREGPWVTLHDPALMKEPDAVPILVPGETPFGRWVVHAGAVSAVQQRPLSRRTLALLDGAGLMIRCAAEGDTISMGDGSKSVFEALREAGVPPRLRRIWPVVEQGGRMVWVVGSRHAPGVAATPGAPAVVVRVEEAR